MKFQDPEELELEYKNAYIKALDSETPEVFAELARIADDYSSLYLSDLLDGHPRFIRDRFIDWKDWEGKFGKGFFYGWLTNDWRYHGADALPLSKEVEDYTRRFQTFAKEYKVFIDRFHLESVWLEKHIRNVLEMRAKYKDAVEGISTFSVIQAMDIRVGEQLKFEWYGMRLDTDPKLYREGALQAFKVHLNNHIKNTQRLFQEKGIKRKTKRRDLDRVKWLVKWNIKRLDKETIRQAISDERPRGIDDSTLDKMFREFRKYDLPIREELSLPEKMP